MSQPTGEDAVGLPVSSASSDVCLQPVGPQLLPGVQTFLVHVGHLDNTLHLDQLTKGQRLRKLLLNFLLVALPLLVRVHVDVGTRVDMSFDADRCRKVELSAEHHEHRPKRMRVGN